MAKLVPKTQGTICFSMVRVDGDCTYLLKEVQKSNFRLMGRCSNSGGKSQRRERQYKDVERSKRAEKVGQLRDTVFFPMGCGPGGSKSRLAKAGAEPSGAKHISKSTCSPHVCNAFGRSSVIFQGRLNAGKPRRRYKHQTAQTEPKNRRLKLLKLQQQRFCRSFA